MTELFFVWDESNKQWVAVGFTKSKYRKSNSLPSSIVEIEGARRFEKGGKNYLAIPKDKESDLVKNNPDFKLGPNDIEKQLKFAKNVIAAPIKAYEKRRAESETVQEFLGIPKEGIAKPITKAVKGFVEGSIGSKPVDIDAPLPGTETKTGSTGSAMDMGTPSAISGKPTAPAPLILGNPNLDEIGKIDLGVFSLPGQEGEFLFLGDPNTEKFSRPIAVEKYETQIYGWTPEQVVAYKKAIKYGNTTPLADSKFVAAVIDKAKEVSNINYFNAKNNKPQQISVEGFISNPAKYGAAGFGSGTGVTVKAEELKAKTATVKQLTTELGVTLSDKEIKDIAYKYASGAIDANTIKYQIAKAGTIDYTKGTAASTLTELKKLAADNGVDFNDTWFQTAAGNIITGRSTLDTLKADINNQAKGIYSAESIQKGIDAGFSVRAQASPYINYLANIRGVDPENVSLNDPFISQAFTARDDKGNPTVMSYFDFRKNVRQNDPQWGYSDEAQTETTSMLRKLGQVFGKSF